MQPITTGLDILRGENHILRLERRMGLDDQEEVDIWCMHTDAPSEAGSVSFMLLCPVELAVKITMTPSVLKIY